MKLKVNQKIELVVNAGRYQGIYPSRVEEITPQSIVVGMPIKQGSLIPLSPGMRLEVYFSQQGTFYASGTEVLAAVKEPIPLLFLKPLTEFRKIQRRNYVRMATILPVQYRVLTKENTEENNDQPIPYIETTSRDIGGGGIAINTNEALKTTTPVELIISLPRTEIRAIGKVVHRDELPPTANMKYALGIEFTEITEQARDQIIRYIFDLQRELRGKGLL